MSLCILLQIYCTKSPTYKVQFQEHIHKFSLLIKSELAKVPNDKISYIVLYCNRFIILFIQITHKKHKNKENILILQYSTSKSTVVSTTFGVQGLPSCEQARTVTSWRREKRWEMAELKDDQQQEMEGKLQFHSYLMLRAQVLFPSKNQMHVRIFESS